MKISIPSRTEVFLDLKDLYILIKPKQYLVNKFNRMIDSLSQGIMIEFHNSHLIQSQDSKQSSHEQSIIPENSSVNISYLKENAIQFINTYVRLSETFPVKQLKKAYSLRTKYYKQSTYYGEFHNGKKQGNGVMVYKNHKIYEGQWENDKKKGNGVQKFSNGCIYQGQYLNGKPSGFGCYTGKNGEYYEGQWSEGRKHGQGLWYSSQGDFYRGQWKFGKPDGLGVYKKVNGDIYEGQFKDNLKHGDGIEKFVNGDQYRGHYENGKPSGYGQYFWGNGSFFKGNFINGLRYGKGIWKKGPGNTDSYEGFYCNDKKWGKGIFIWENGNIYKGNYQGDTRNGFGVMKWTNGGYYRGNWLNGVQHGQGEIYLPDKGYRKGKFDNNVLIELNSEAKMVNDPIHMNTIKNESYQITFKSKEMSQILEQKNKQQLNIKEKPILKNKALFSERHNLYRKKINIIQDKQYSKNNNPLVKQDIIAKSNLQFQLKLKIQMSEKKKLSSDFRSKNLSAREGQHKQFFNTIKANPPTSDSKRKCSVQSRCKKRVLHSSFYLYNQKFKKLSNKGQAQNFYEYSEFL